MIDYVKKFSEIKIDQISVTPTEYSLSDLYYALEFAIVSEGAMNNPSIYEKMNVLKTSLHGIINSDSKVFFEYNDYVSRENLETLLDLCKDVKEKAVIKDGKIQNGSTLKDGVWEPNMVDGKFVENAEEIAKILPTQDGFFFGSIEYDEYYMDDIYNTIEMLEKILKEEDELNKDWFYSDFEYHASW